MYTLADNCCCFKIIIFLIIKKKGKIPNSHWQEFYDM